MHTKVMKENESIILIQSMTHEGILRAVKYGFSFFFLLAMFTAALISLVIT